MEVEFELTCGANARLLGRGCARGMVGKDALRSVRLDGRGTASRPAHGETKYQGIRAGAENRGLCEFQPYDLFTNPGYLWMGEDDAMVRV
jgi:hypothetical protein